MIRFILAMMCGGAFLAYTGWQEFELSKGASEVPAEVTLAQLEAGEVPENPHLRIGEHWAMYQELVYSYTTRDTSKDAQPGNKQKRDYTDYPSVSPQNQFFEDVALLEKLYGSVDDIPDDKFPQHVDFTVLVRSKQYKRMDLLPEPAWTLEAGVAGMVVNEVRSLREDEKRLVAEGFPKVNISKLMILEAGRKPSSAAKSYAMMGGGAFITLLPLAGFIRRGDKVQKITAQAEAKPDDGFDAGRPNPIG